MSTIVQPNLNPMEAGAPIAKGTFVKIVSGKVVQCAANTDASVGVCQNEVAQAGDIAEVAMPGGGALVRASESIVAGKLLVPHTNGRAAQSNASGDRVGAMALESAVLDDFFSCMVMSCVATAADQ